MSIILIRHGETALNVARTFQPADTPLSARGIAQAGSLARRLAHLGLAGILSSDLPRALATAQYIAAATGLPIVTTALLHERNFGDLRGLAYDSLGYNPLAEDAAPPGGESGPDFRRRVALAFAQAVRMRTMLAGPLAVVTHGLVIRVLLGTQLLLRAGDHPATHLGNTSVTVVSATAPHAVELLDCTLHLAAGATDNADALSGG